MTEADRTTSVIEEFLINNRIAAPEYGYPASEARYLDIEEWERETGLSMKEELDDGEG